MIVWLVLLFAGILGFGLRTHLLAHALFVTAMILALVLVCLWKGEPPRWRWGE